MKRIPELDSIRGLAAVTVVLFHAFPFTFFLGWSAVDLFFVLSGYLITTVIITGMGQDGFLAAFYYRRVLRIWPVYFITLAVVLVCNALSGTGYATDGLFQNLTFTQNIQGYWGAPVPAFPHAFAPSWSIAVEEQFYLIWPLLLLVVGARRIPAIAAVMLVATVTARVAGLPFNIWLGRADGLALGCLLAASLTNPANLPKLKKLLPPVGLISFGYLLVLACAWWGDPEPRWVPVSFLAFGLFYFSVVGLVVCHTGHRLLSVLRNKHLCRLGLISYSLYLFHAPVMHYAPVTMTRLGLTSPALLQCVTWAAVILLPVLSYRLIEKPILGLKDRVSYRKFEPVTLEGAMLLENKTS